nr:immunoglobulin heavy chain junction region [Macaca mulatta]MOX01734.1 immunoglobulin heavy chain junction region [Macaca mulatta]
CTKLPDNYFFDSW